MWRIALNINKYEKIVWVVYSNHTNKLRSY